MAVYNLVKSPLGPVHLASTFTLYRRESNIWYVSFYARGRQYRRSTGLTDEAEARVSVLARRKLTAHCGPERGVDRAHIRKMLARAAKRASVKGIPYSLKIADVVEAAIRCGGRCEVSGVEFEDRGPFQPSLDRIVPALGYVPSNIRVVCLITNTAMLHYGEDCLFKLAIAICRNRGFLAQPAANLPSAQSQSPP